jgi:hypothetical protein
MTMQCNCYFNSTGFKVGYKYLYLIDINTNKSIKKIKLDEYYKNELIKIDEQFSSHDVNRTLAVIRLIK